MTSDITPAINDNFGDVPGRRYVTLVIEEGARTTVCKLTLTGIDADDESKIWPSLVNKPTRPYSLDGAHADRDRILDYLADHGYTHATASWRTTPAKTAHQVDLEFQFVPGAQERIQHIVVLGNEHVRRGLVNRELLIHEGEPISQSAVHESQRRLYDLGIFNQVQITPQDAARLPTQTKPCWWAWRNPAVGCWVMAAASKSKNWAAMSRRGSTRRARDCR